MHAKTGGLLQLYDSACRQAVVCGSTQDDMHLYIRKLSVIRAQRGCNQALAACMYSHARLLLMPLW